jgi:hypothetical protein
MLLQRWGLRWRWEREKLLGMKHIQRILALTICLAAPALTRAESIPQGSKLFIAPMENGLDGFIVPELFKNKIPFKVVTDENDADYVLTGASVKADDKWYNTVFGGKDKNEGNVKLLEVKTKGLVWAGEAGDRSLWWGNLRRGGQRKVAERLAKQMKKDLFTK